MIFYCLKCWSRVKEDEKICHECKADIEPLDHRSYFEKLIGALNHFERTTRLRAADGKSVTSGFPVTSKMCPSSAALNNAFVPVLAAVLSDQFSLASSEGCFFNSQALPNNTFNPILQACLTMQTSEECSS